jgi:hypothetical protein
MMIFLDLKKYFRKITVHREKVRLKKLLFLEGRGGLELLWKGRLSGVSFFRCIFLNFSFKSEISIQFRIF